MRKLIPLLALLPAISLAQEIPSGVIIDGKATATLTWTVPTERENDTPLPVEEIAGYVIFWQDTSRFLADGTTLRTNCTERPEGSRNDTGCYSNVIDLTDGTASSEVLTLTLDQDVTLFFAAVAHDSDGNWSAYSNEAAKIFTLEVGVTNPKPPVIQSIDMSITCTTNLPSVTCSFTVTDP